MQKSITSPEYAQFLQTLRESRERAGLTQADMADRLGETQSFVSKCERGERRIDVIELQAFCKAMGISLTSFIQRLDKKLR